MATRFSPSLLADVTTDARLQANAQFIEDTLVSAGGWVVTADSGQTLPSALVHPTVANSKKGYRIYKMADTLQATSPVFVRLDFGSGPVASIFGLWITIGTGSDGAGNITGMLHNGGARAQGISTNTPGTGVGNSYGSADNGRFSFALYVGTSNFSFCQVFTLERSKSLGGSDTGNGLILIWSDYATGNFAGPSHIKYLICAGGSQPAEEIGLNYSLPGVNPCETWFPGDSGLGVVIPFKGMAQQPGMNVVIVGSADMGPESNFKTIIYGRAVGYQHLNNVYVYKAIAGSQNGDNNARACIRYD